MDINFHMSVNFAGKCTTARIVHAGNHTHYNRYMSSILDILTNIRALYGSIKPCVLRLIVYTEDFGSVYRRDFVHCFYFFSMSIIPRIKVFIKMTVTTNICVWQYTWCHEFLNFHYERFWSPYCIQYTERSKYNLRIYLLSPLYSFY